MPPQPKPVLAHDVVDYNTDVAATTFAGFWKRFAAFLLDMLILVVTVSVIGLVLVNVLQPKGFTQEEIEAVGNLVGLIVNWLYFASMESSQVQGTLGKLALGIKVTNLDGQRISFGRATGRHFVKILSWIILGIGCVMAAFTKKKQALHDMVANCLVANRLG